MRRLDAKFPTRRRSSTAAFRAVAWELMVGYAGRSPDLEVASTERSDAVAR
jgi:hypothetical protein